MSKRNTVIKLGLATPLLLIFITLKLCNVIQWSWLWVLSPFWIPFALIAIVLAAFVIFLGVMAVLDILVHMKKKKK
jgi:predicted membrane protein